MNGGRAHLKDDCVVLSVHHRALFSLLPEVDELACEAYFAWYFRQSFACEPSALVELRTLEFQRSAGIFRHESHHESAGIRPRLTLDISEVFDGDVGFFHHFAMYAFLQCFPGFDKSGNESQIVALEFVALNQKNLLTFVACDGHDDGCCQCGPYFLSAVGATLGNVGVHRHWCAANTAEFGATIPVEQFAGLSGHEIEWGGKCVKRLSQPNHFQVLVAYGSVNAKGAAGYSVEVGKLHDVMPRLLLDGRLFGVGNYIVVGQQNRVAEKYKPIGFHSVFIFKKAGSTDYNNCVVTEMKPAIMSNGQFVFPVYSCVLMLGKSEIACFTIQEIS